jgi:hypothetical protein
MSRTLLLALPVLFVALLPAQPKPGTAAEAAAPHALQSIERFNNQQLALFAKGKPAAAHVTIRDWQLHGQLKVDKFPETGPFVVELHSGKVTTMINGKEEKRNPGDFWTVPAGATMSVQVTSESAALHVLAVSRPGATR